MRPAWGAAALLAALAATDAAAQPAAPGRNVVQQKEALVQRLLNDSPAVKRIAGSDNAEAKRFFASARERHGEALASIAAGELERAEAQLNEAMWMAGKARQLVPDTMRREIELRVKNRALALSIDSLRASYQAQLARRQGLAAGAKPLDERLKRVDARLEEAMTFATSEHVDKTHAALESIERELMEGLTQVLGTDVEYRLRFDTQAEEFAYELARNRGYRDLLPIARADLKPAREALATMERMVAASASLVERAEARAKQRDFVAALDAVRQATGQLQMALAAAGLRMPTDAASAPLGALR